MSDRPHVHFAHPLPALFVGARWRWICSCHWWQEIPPSALAAITQMTS